VKKIQALVLGVLFVFIGVIFAVISQKGVTTVDKKVIGEDKVRRITCYIPEKNFVLVNIYQNYNWTDPEGEGAIYDYDELTGRKTVYATLSVYNEKGNLTAFTITYFLEENRMVLALGRVEIQKDEGALNLTPAFFPNGTYKFAGEPWIACGETITSGNYTISFGKMAPGNRNSPPARIEVAYGTVTFTYPYYYLLPVGLSFVVAGVGIPSVVTFKENRDNKRKRRLISKVAAK
jgi:hypothetical protein